MELGFDPKVDYAFKKVFGTEETALVLIDLLHAVVHPTMPITGLAIRPAHSQKAAPADKQAIGDIRANDQGNRQFHVEMQWHAPWFFPKRVLYYWSRFHPEQLREGEGYQTLRPTISICFTNDILYPEVTDHHLVFRLKEATQGLVWCDDLEIHLIELPKFTRTVEEVSSALDRWCYFLRHAAGLDPDHLPPTLDVPAIRRAMEVLKVFTQDEQEREIYEARLKFQRDQISWAQELQERREAMEIAIKEKEQATKEKEQATKEKEQATKEKEQAIEAKEQAIEAKEQAIEAKEQAIKEGLVGQIHIFQQVLKQPLTPAAELDSQSQEDLRALLAHLRKQALPNGA
jgi:predicted transposase/invertase (TIGR01784 family)